MMVRAPQADDWNRILDVANASVGDVPNAGPQDKWLGNRRDFDYAADARFVTFIQSWGYTETRRFVHDGRQLVVMSKHHTDESIQT